MKRLLKILGAKIRCHFYLLTQGMFRGECYYRIWNQRSRLIFVGAFRGSLARADGHVTRTFYKE
jgi:hypothetical protein